MMNYTQKNLWIRGILLLVLAVFIVFAAGCGGGNKEDPSTPYTPREPDTLIEPGAIEYTNQVTQYGITFKFDKVYPVGIFANGDYWVQGPVIITEMIPGFNGKHHGWQVNPIPGAAQGFDDRVSRFEPNLAPGLPYTAGPGQSIVKTISKIPQGEKVCIQTAAVLTVLEETPPGNGVEVFRPPYVGTQKPFYRVSDIRRELIPHYSSVDNTPSLTTAKEWFQRVQLDHFGDGRNQYARPEDNLPEYGAGVASRTANGALRLMIDGPEDEYMGALIAYLQCGLDYYYMMKDGWIWGRGGGESPGNKLPTAFFVTLLGDEQMKETVRNCRMYEDYLVLYGKNGVVLWGDWGWGSRATSPLKDMRYWVSIAYDGTSRTIVDPHAYIDGGYVPGGSYQYCCTSQAFKGTVLALLLMPELQKVWKPEALFDYADRWVTFGAWTLPDPYAAVDGETEVEKRANEGITWGPDPNNLGEAIKDGIGRFPHLHGSNTDKGLYGSKFYSSMWEIHRASAPGADLTPPFAAIINNLEGKTIRGQVELRASAYGIHGIHSVEFRVNGQSIGIGTQEVILNPTGIDKTKKNLPYRLSWDTKVLTNGNYSLTVVAIDNRGNSHESVVVSVTVEN